MKKLFLAALLTLVLNCSPANATTYYVRTDGGTAAQCNGTVDAPVTTTNTNIVQGCAFNHPFWLLSTKDGPVMKLAGGDTVIVAPGDYLMGVGAPNTPNCSLFYPWDCWSKAIPSGTAAQPTRILGKGWDTATGAKPRFIGIERSDKVLNLNGSSNVELQYIEITDGSECIVTGPGTTACKRTGDGTSQGQWAVRGIQASDSSNVLLKNVYIHGLYAGVEAARLTNWTIENTDILNNSFVGWNGDMGKTTSSNSGITKFKNTRIKGSGCGERLSTKAPYSCYSQDQGGYGDGLGTEATGGDWVFDGVDFSENVSDGLDLLYHTGNGKITVTNSKFERNAGNQIKTGTTASLSNVKLDGNCAWFKGQPFTSTLAVGGGSVAFNNCRAGGDVFAASLKAGTKVDIQSTTFTNVLNIGVMTSGTTCNGTEVVSADPSTTFDLKAKYYDPTTTAVKYYASGATGNGDGPCGLVKLTGSSTTTPPSCVSNGSCSAAIPTCGQTTTGVDNCGTTCTRTGSTCVQNYSLSMVLGGGNYTTGTNIVLKASLSPANSNAKVSFFYNNTLLGIGTFDGTNYVITASAVPVGTYVIYAQATDTVGTLATSPSVTAVVADACISNGSCNAPTPACGQSTVGVDNCGTSCTVVGSPCVCVVTSCNAAAPACNKTTTGTDNCGASCTKVGPKCCVSDSTKCGAVNPITIGQVTTGKDNCGTTCYKVGQFVVKTTYTKP